MIEIINPFLFWTFVIGVLCFVVLVVTIITAREIHHTQRTQWMRKDSIKEEIREFAANQEDAKSAQWWLLFLDFIDNFDENTNTNLKNQ